MPQVLSYAVDQLKDFVVSLVKSIKCRLNFTALQTVSSILEMQTSISNHGCKHTKLTKVAEPKSMRWTVCLPAWYAYRWLAGSSALPSHTLNLSCVLSVLYLCKFCLDKGCRIKLGAFQRNAFNLDMNMVWQQIFFCLVTFEAAVLFCLL